MKKNELHNKKSADKFLSNSSQIYGNEPRPETPPASGAGLVLVIPMYMLLMGAAMGRSNGPEIL
ncbi:MAG: hypothetical protein MO852_11655 [Candidatus Devosia euplotis]|nr:hypothetical protein [Candidatus Devosia euplotis]